MQGRLKKCLVCTAEFQTNEAVIKHMKKRHSDWLGTDVYKNFEKLVADENKEVLKKVKNTKLPKAKVDNETKNETTKKETDSTPTNRRGK